MSNANSVDDIYSNWARSKTVHPEEEKFIHKFNIDVGKTFSQGTLEAIYGGELYISDYINKILENIKGLFKIPEAKAQEKFKKDKL